MHTVKLLTFEEAKKQADEVWGKRHMLLGNGFSIGVHEKFDYGTLYKQAKASGLPKHVEELFNWYGTTNFEEVLRHLKEGMRLAKHYELVKTNCALDMENDHQDVKEALVNAITSVHPASRNAVAEGNLQSCNAFLRQFHNVFTTNYDLLLYWAILVDQPPAFKDGFRQEDDKNPEYLLFVDVPPSPNNGEKYIYFLHGALHLYVEGDEVRKVRWGDQNPPLIEQIKQALEDDRFPLVVSEGAPDHKKARIATNKYLSACKRNFQKIEGSLFVFGSSLDNEDIHVLEWISQNRNLKRIFVGVYGDPKEAKNQAMIARIRDQVDPDHTYAPNGRSGKVVFYDSGTANVWTTPAPKGRKTESNRL